MNACRQCDTVDVSPKCVEFYDVLKFSDFEVLVIFCGCDVVPFGTLRILSGGTN